MFGVPEGDPSYQESTGRTVLGAEQKRRRLVSEQARIVGDVIRGGS